MKFKIVIILFIFLLNTVSWGQQSLPTFNKSTVAIQQDWLIRPIQQKTAVYTTSNNELVLSNGIVSRTFTTTPNAATIGVDHLRTNESFLRSVRPEAEVEIDGITFAVGGLTGQAIHNYLLKEWIPDLKTDPAAFQFKTFKIENTKARFPWKKRLEWIPKDMPWPAPGKELIFEYQLNDEALQLAAQKMLSDENRPVLVNDKFEVLDKNWSRFESPADARNSFINEGKPGEIMSLANTAVYADREFKKGTKVVVAKINPGTDQSSSWGPGLGLVFPDKVVKINLRPNNNEFGFFDGEHEKNSKGLLPGKAAWLRFEIKGNKITGEYSYDKILWNEIGNTTVSESPNLVRVGKMDWMGNNSDNKNNGERGRCLVEELQMLGTISDDVKNATTGKFQYMKNITVKVHYELYDGMPVFSKWVTIDNNTQQTIVVNKFKSEILAIPEPESIVDNVNNWVLSNITVETDYNFGGMSPENVFHSSVAWSEDQLYKTQVNYQRKTRCLLEVYPKYGPEQEIEPGKTFSTYRVWELLHDSWDRERKGLEHRRMMRAMAPWITENPILMHVRNAKNEAVKKAVDQCVDVGFEKIIMTFGSGFNVEDTSPENIARMKMLADYAHSKGITLGGYSLLASRRVGGGNDVVMPAGMTPKFGNSPCLESKWGQEYFKKLYSFYEKTGLDNLEHDGSYPGDICASTTHPGHKGLEDSQWNQYKRITDFYKWCRAKGIYLNVPDYYFLSGSNKTGMGYRETNWSLPRAQQEIIERQNIYDGTWQKTPSMGWMFVPLVQYHGGGAAATIEPLKEHLPHYQQRLANLFGAGVQACYRGPELYDAPETRDMVKKWVDFYKKYRRILDADIIHVRRPDGRDYDAILHVEPTNKIKGMLLVYNPLNEPIHRKIKVNLYYTGLTNLAKVSQEAGSEKTVELDNNYNAWFEMDIPAKSQTWFTIK
ncbi:MAG: hypothetical protein J7L95_01180 [Prolixibacteraceae bacterium]|nr:hypothetical protein [Prolixibacteraceae bacterium]